MYILFPKSSVKHLFKRSPFQNMHSWCEEELKTPFFVFITVFLKKIGQIKAKTIGLT